MHHQVASSTLFDIGQKRTLAKLKYEMAARNALCCSTLLGMNEPIDCDKRADGRTHMYVSQMLIIAKKC